MDLYTLDFYHFLSVLLQKSQSVGFSHPGNLDSLLLLIYLSDVVLARCNDASEIFTFNRIARRVTLAFKSITVPNLVRELSVCLTNPSPFLR